MITRFHLLVLLYLLAGLVTLLAVLGAFQGLAITLGASQTAYVFSWGTGTVAVLLCVNVLLLVAALALQAASNSSGAHGADSHER